MELDRKISDYFVSHQTPRFTFAFGMITHLGAGAVWITAYAFLFLFLRERAGQLLYTLVLAEIMGLAAIVMLRYMTRRERPAKRYKCFYLTPWNQYSFPSHHALRSFFIAFIVGKEFPVLFPVLLVVAAIVGFSRVYLAKHFLSDVVVGALLGFLVATGTEWLM